MSEWLSNEKIETFALELITPEFINRVEERIEFLQNSYDKDNKKKLIDMIVSILDQCLNKFNGIIDRTGISLANNANRSPADQSKYEMDIFKKLRKGEFIIEPKSEEELIRLRNSLKIHTAHFVMHRIQNVKGELTWNDVNNVVEQTKEAKKKIDGDSTTTHNSVKEKQNNISIESIRTLDDLLKGKSEIYANLLKTTLEKEEKKVRILSDNSWIKGRKAFSIVIAWMDSLQQAKKFKMANISDQQKSHLINNYFKDFNMNESESSLWRKHGPIYTKYKEIFDKEIIRLNK